MNLSLDSKGKPLEAPCKYRTVHHSCLFFVNRSGTQCGLLELCFPPISRIIVLWPSSSAQNWQSCYNIKVTEIIFLSHSEKARLTGTTHSLTKSANRCHNATCTWKTTLPVLIQHRWEVEMRGTRWWWFSFV